MELSKDHSQDLSFNWTLHFENPISIRYSQSCLKQPPKNTQNEGLKDRW